MHESTHMPITALLNYIAALKRERCASLQPNHKPYPALFPTGLYLWPW